MDSPETSQRCIHCGWSNPEERTTCVHCGAPLVSGDELSEAVDELLPVEASPDISSLHLKSDVENGFSYPDWAHVHRQVRKLFPEEQWQAVYHELSKQWLLELKEELGGDYRCYESANFFVVCAQGSNAGQTLLQIAENSLSFLASRCGPLLNRKTYGKRVIIAFDEEDDYYTYISHFHEEGDHSRSAGIMIHGGYWHIAVILKHIVSARQIITHELVHNCIAHLPVPTWLHEGLAQKLEHMAGGGRFILDHDLVAQHQEHWNEKSIQGFWSGASFYGPDEGNKLSYSLAEILVNLLSDDWNSFLQFVLHADYRDAGQNAALDALDKNLGEVTAEFLGPGNWRPQRKIIADHHRKPAAPDPDGKTSNRQPGKTLLV